MKNIIDLFNKFYIIVNGILRLTKLNKEEIDEIILIGGWKKTLKIKEMIKKYFI